MDLALAESRNASGMILMLGAIALYAATRVATFVASQGHPAAAGRRALAQWFPAVVTAIVAVIMGQPEIALGIVLATSVAALSLVAGIVFYFVPMQDLPPVRRTWALILPPAALLLLAGFSAHLGWGHAIMLLIAGATFLGVWLERSPIDAQAAELTQWAERPKAAVEPAHWLLLFGFIALAVLGAWLMVRGGVATAERSRMFTVGLLASAVISPLLMLPTIGTATALAQQSHSSTALTALVGTVLLNLCALLPAIILLHYVRSALPHRAEAGGVLKAFYEFGQPLPYGLLAWRVDTVVLVVLGIALLPLSMGRWIPGRLEAAMLIFAYTVYLMVTTYSLRVM